MSKLQETRERVLEAALEIFAAQGYAGAKVRDICQKADCNLAAVNYYFGDKDGCYQAVREYARQLYSKLMEHCWEKIGEDPWEALKIHIELLLDHTYNSTISHINWLHLRDMLDNNQHPPVAPNENQAVQIELYGQHLTELLTALLGNAATQENISLIRYTYHSLCLFLPIQTKVEKSCLKGRARFQLSEHHNKAFLTDYILNIVRQTVDKLTSDK